MTQSHEVSKCCWRSSADRRANAGWPQAFQFAKKCNARASCEAQESKVCLYSNFRFKGKRILKRFPIKTLIKKVECLINIKGNLRTRKIIRLYFIMIKGSSIHREHTSLLAMCATKNHLKICKANLTELNRKLDKFTVTVRDFYTPLSGW